MDIYNIKAMLEGEGFWMTLYHVLNSREYDHLNCTQRAKTPNLLRALWMIWVAWNALAHDRGGYAAMIVD